MTKLLRIVVAATVALALGPIPPQPVSAGLSPLLKLDPQLHAGRGLLGRSRVIVRVNGPQGLASVASAAEWMGARALRPLPLIDGLALDLPNAALAALAANPAVIRVSRDRTIAGANERTGATIGSTAVRSRLGVSGHGVGVAVIDSGVMASHDDLASRVDRFVDFTSGRPHPHGDAPHDDFGHGTHVAGIVAGNGANSNGARAGVAPGARLTVLKVLDADGRGRISDVIEALGYAVAHRQELNLRVVNLSIAAAVYESYLTDPLTLAAREAVGAGLVVVAAAGNNGRGPDGRVQYGGITAPGNAPWVLTVGASSHLGTADRGDDAIAAFSSRGPTAVDHGAKPDLVAPGVGIESLSDPSGSLYTSNAAALLPGTGSTPYLPYMSLSGTSMSAPVVSGTVAMMLEANPLLTPNAVKAILQYTAQAYAGHDPLTQGAGFLNADGAISLAAWYAAPATTPYPDASAWSRRIIWGSRLLEGPDVTPGAVPWAATIAWGTEPAGLTVIGNVVWGLLCGGEDCAAAWDTHIVTTANDPGAQTVVWGTSDGEYTVVWGTRCTDPSCEPVVWGGQ